MSNETVPLKKSMGVRIWGWIIIVLTFISPIMIIAPIIPLKLLDNNCFPLILSLTVSLYPSCVFLITGIGLIKFKNFFRRLTIAVIPLLVISLATHLIYYLTTLQALLLKQSTESIIQFAIFFMLTFILLLAICGSYIILLCLLLNSTVKAQFVKNYGRTTENHPKKSAAFKTVLIFALIITCLYALLNPMMLRIHHNAMYPALSQNDIVILNRLSYLATPPKRGDIIIFRQNDEPVLSAGRVIGLPGENVIIKDTFVYINGLRLNDLPESEYETYYYNAGKFGKSTSEITVPEHHVYVLGDNSAQSNDSRFWGFLPISNIEGKVTAVSLQYLRWEAN